MFVLPVLLLVAVVTYGERKIWAAMQYRKGPNVVGPIGLFQPLADGLKLLMKETIIPTGANRVLFIMAPMIMFTLGLIGWAVIPFRGGARTVNGYLATRRLWPTPAHSRWFSKWSPNPWPMR